MKAPFHVGNGELLVWRRMIDGLPAIVIDRREPADSPGWRRMSCSIEGDLVLTFATTKQARRVWRTLCPKHPFGWFDRWRSWPAPENPPGVEAWIVTLSDDLSAAIRDGQPSPLPTTGNRAGEEGRGE
jgi:hypothetical protein